MEKYCKVECDLGMLFIQQVRATASLWDIVFIPANEAMPGMEFFYHSEIKVTTFPNDWETDSHILDDCIDALKQIIDYVIDFFPDENWLIGNTDDFENYIINA